MLELLKKVVQFVKKKKKKKKMATNHLVSHLFGFLPPNTISLPVARVSEEFKIK